VLLIPSFPPGPSRAALGPVSILLRLWFAQKLYLRLLSHRHALHDGCTIANPPSIGVVKIFFFAAINFLTRIYAEGETAVMEEGKEQRILVATAACSLQGYAMTAAQYGYGSGRQYAEANAPGCSPFPVMCRLLAFLMGKLGMPALPFVSCQCSWYLLLRLCSSLDVTPKEKAEISLSSVSVDKYRADAF
jgi:hypothetical protein